MHYLSLLHIKISSVSHFHIFFSTEFAQCPLVVVVRGPEDEGRRVFLVTSHIWRRLSNVLGFVQTTELALACSYKVVIVLLTYMVIKLDFYGHKALYSRIPYHNTQTNHVRSGKQPKQTIIIVKTLP